MSDKPDRQEKVHDPSPSRLRKAREDGNVFKSKELISVGVLGAGGAALVFGAPAAFATLRELSARLFLGAASTPLDVDSMPSLFAGVGVPVLGLLLPFFAVVMAAGAAASVAQTGWNVTTKPLTPKGSRVSPLEGLKRLFSTKGVFEAGKALTKVAVVGPIAYGVLRDRADEMLGLSTLPVDAIAAVTGTWVVDLGAPVLLALLLLAAVDYAFEKHKWTSDLKMTDKEVKDEGKEQEGDPHLKGKRRQRARELATRPRLDHAVMQADVVVTNPTHYAVALRFDPAAGGAPTVLCKGVRKRALAIKGLAAELGIPTVEDRPLARALHATVDEGAPIDESLYAAVAAVLAEVYRRRAA
ncbi:EscU/YscU/HrcU family type III secretion system export apparatus switch protein [Rubrivirga litoralis]|uniref:EscU/YscU/HrcU family type III secretion system export apparatus switch protein n=1 Tax=Rubrivirga litoralis TaxID=3075598 RepID=A0ABU3BQ14_9BACT|nr:EscU/YscU/HrcU family type III secretion system export apparatus switch protein [Rubrivirga sp. F394]MDT0631380.1 EscU/YscU/HrcU family type III secretion system export apparatus switch protein [Rubrivirga sp. F394]